MTRPLMATLGVFAAVLLACGGSIGAGSAGPTTATSASPSTNVISTPLATTGVASPASTSPVAEGLLPMTFAVVTATELNVRVAPSTSAGLLEAMFVEMPLPKGTRLLNLGDAINADGYLWYLAALISDAGAPVGWVASGPPEDPWLRPDDTECPPANLAGIIALTPVERLGCFGSRSVGFEGRQVTAPEDAGFGGVCGDEDPGPAWLVCENYNWVHVDGDPEHSLNLYFDPAAGIEPTGLADPGTVGELWTIQGHFGDAAAIQCGDALDPTSLEYQTARLECATRFVVEDLDSAE